MCVRARTGVARLGVEERREMGTSSCLDEAKSLACCKALARTADEPHLETRAQHRREPGDPPGTAGSSARSGDRMKKQKGQQERSEAKVGMDRH